MEYIYDGDLISCWEDDELIYLAFPWAVVIMPVEEWSKVVTDLTQLIITCREKELEELKHKKSELN